MDNPMDPMDKKRRRLKSASLFVGIVAVALAAVGVFEAMAPPPLRNRADICIHNPGGDAFMPSVKSSGAGKIVWDKAASQTSTKPDWECDPSRIMKLLLGGKTYIIGYRVTDADGNDATPNVGLRPGDAHITIYDTQLHMIAHAFAVEQRGHLLAITDGYGDNFKRTRVGEISVSVGKKDGHRSDSDCGYQDGHELIFHARSSTALANGKHAVLDLSTGPVNVMNVSTWVYPEDNYAKCTDTWGPQSWMAWSP